MKEAYWGYWLIVLGVFIIIVLLLVQSFTSTNTQDYYLVKTITEASMQDAIDYGYWRQYGEAKINKEKFYESFIRRFAEEASLSTTYEIEFYEVYEAPPKVGVKVSSKSSSFRVVSDSTTFDIVNKIDAILETSTHEQNVESSSNIEAGDYSDLVPYLNEDTLKYNAIRAKNCTLSTPFAGTECGAASTNLIVARCGIPTEEGTKVSLNGKYLEPGKTYCITYSTTNTKCTMIATYAQMESEYCS